jgi:hypothetical protein
VNEFVEECRSEWKRLGVPDPVANEMVAELSADLEEAKAEGASPEDVLGTGAFDPRSFAADWAAERGVVQRPLPGGYRHPRYAVLTAIGAFALIALVGAVLVIHAAPSASGRLALAAQVRPPLAGVWVRGPAPPPGPARAVVVAAPLPAAGARSVPVDIDDSAVETRTVGSVLLTLGLAGVVLSTMFWLWVEAGRWSGLRGNDDGWTGSA